MPEITAMFPCYICNKTSVFRLLLGTLMLLAALYGCRRSGNEAPVQESKPLTEAIEAADHQIFIRNREAATRIVDSAIASLKEPTVTDSFNYLRFYYMLSLEYDKDPEKALEYTELIKEVIERNGVTQKLASYYALVYYWRGDILFATGDYNNAYEEYYKGREVGEKVLDACGLSDYNYRLGKVLYQQQRFGQSLKQFQKCLELKSACREVYTHRYRTQEVLSNVGLCHYHLRQPDSAAAYFEAALVYIDTKLKPTSEHQERLYAAAKAVVLGNLGSVRMQQHEDSAAEQMFRESIFLNLQSGREQHDAMLTTLKLARLYQNTGSMEKAAPVLHDARRMLDSVPDIEGERTWNYLMAMQTVSRDPAQAFNHLATYDRLRDSLSKVNAVVKSVDLREHISNIEKEHEIHELKRNYEEDRFFLVIALVVASLSVIIIGFVIFYMRKLRGYLRHHTTLNKKVTEQKEQLLQAFNKLEQANKEKDKILSVVAHDLRSPINSIYALADILLLEDDLNPDQRETLELIKTASQTSLALSKEILESAILMQSKELKLEKLNFNELIAHTVGLLRFRAAEKHQLLQLDLPDYQLMMDLDKDKIQRVINNLITNAIKFSKEHTEVSIRLRRTDEGVLISIRDQGIGIPDKIQDKVFEMFTVAKREGTGGEKPFGLGLSISRQIIEAHGGNIWLESQEGLGTTFFILLPVSKVIHNGTVSEWVSPSYS